MRKRLREIDHEEKCVSSPNKYVQKRCLYIILYVYLLCRTGMCAIHAKLRPRRPRPSFPSIYSRRVYIITVLTINTYICGLFFFVKSNIYVHRHKTRLSEQEFIFVIIFTSRYHRQVLVDRHASIDFFLFLSITQTLYVCSLFQSHSFRSRYNTTITNKGPTRLIKRITIIIRYVPRNIL